MNYEADRMSPFELAIICSLLFRLTENVSFRKHFLLLSIIFTKYKNVKES